jgi:hypothetical protein
VADEVIRIDVEFQVMEYRQAQRLVRAPLESRAQIDWVARFEAYYRIWNPLTGLDYDLRLAAAAHQADNQRDWDLFSIKSLYYYARFVFELEGFVRQLGGLWLTPSRDGEQRLADLVWHIPAAVPLDEFQESQLRVALRADLEPIAFRGLIAADEQEQFGQLTTDWFGWLRGCACDPQAIDPECKVHSVASFASEFATVLDAEWDRLADWYIAPRPSSSVGDAVTQREGGSD